MRTPPSKYHLLKIYKGASAQSQSLLILISMAAQRKTSEDKFTPAFLLHLYDELIESKPSEECLCVYLYYLFARN